MPYTTHHDVRIHYHVEGEGTAFVLQHGFFGSMDDWYEYGYVSQLTQAYRVILIDARGHGGSDKPHQPDKYDLLLHAGDIVAVLDALQVQQCHYLGFSMGGRIGLALTRYQPERIRSMIVMGAHAYQTDTIPLQDGVKNMEVWVPEAANLSPAHKARLLNNDRHALLAAATAHHHTSNVDALKQITFPCLVLAGEADELCEQAKHISQAIEGSTFVCLQGLDHVDTLVRSDTVLPHIMRFLNMET